MDFAYSPKVLEHIEQLEAFMEQHVYPDRKSTRLNSSHT